MRFSYKVLSHNSILVTIALPEKKRLSASDLLLRMKTNLYGFPSTNNNFVNFDLLSIVVFRGQVKGWEKAERTKTEGSIEITFIQDTALSALQSRTSHCQLCLMLVNAWAKCYNIHFTD